MLATTKRPAASTRSRAAPSKQHPTPNITQFTRVSKGLCSSDRKKVVPAPAEAPKVTPATPVTPVTPSSRKRKVAVAAIDDSDSSADETPIKSRLAPPIFSPSATPARTPAPIKRGRGRPLKKNRATPSLKRARSPSVSDSDLSTINTDKLFKRLRLESSPSRGSSPQTAATSVADSDAESDISLTATPPLPQEVLGLIDLHSALLKSLTLHYAHNGPHVPVDLHELCPNVTRAWRRRKVTELDIRTSIGVLQTKGTNALFTLSNYGRDKICVEIDPSHGNGPLNENKLNGVFRSNLEGLWAGAAVNGKPDAATFINSLPKAPITVCGSAAKASAFFATGHKRVEELKQDFAAKKQEKDNKPTASAASPLTNPDGSKMSLLDRIRFKQLQRSSLPAGLSPAQLERRAALHRVEEVAALVGMLSRASAGGQGRISFTMIAMLEKLKDSFRMGISKEEGAVALRLLAVEIAPEWVRVVTIGKRENVVIETDRQLSKAEIARRAQAVIAKE